MRERERAIILFLTVIFHQVVDGLSHCGEDGRLWSVRVAELTQEGEPHVVVQGDSARGRGRGEEGGGGGRGVE